MGFLLERCRFSPLGRIEVDVLGGFDCGNPDLNEFFKLDAQAYTSQLLGKSYCFIEDETKRIVGAFTVANDSIKVRSLPNARKKRVLKEIPAQKRFQSYPAVLIGRLGIDSAFKGKHLGSELMDFIKAWFIDENNKTGCRFIVVDAYNEVPALAFYERNGFGYLFSSDSQEAETIFGTTEKSLSTRLMYFDLITLKP
ncbi:MAG: GNAT family N-acetyltransferase [Flavobacteriales bacterium]